MKHLLLNIILLILFNVSIGQTKTIEYYIPKISMTVKFPSEFKLTPKEDKKITTYKNQLLDSFNLGMAEIIEKDSILLDLYLGDNPSNLINRINIHLNPINSLTKLILGDSIEFMNYITYPKLSRPKSNIIEDTILAFGNVTIGGKVFSRLNNLIKMNGNELYFGTYRAIHENYYLFIDFSCPKSYFELINHDIEQADFTQ